MYYPHVLKLCVFRPCVFSVSIKLSEKCLCSLLHHLLTTVLPMAASLPCASPHLGWAAAPCQRQQDLSGGAGASRLGDWGSHMWSYHIAALLLELGLRVALLPTMYVGLGAEGEPYGAGAGWAADILPSPWLRSTSAAVVRIGNRCLAHATESSHLPFGSCMDFGKCNEFCVLQLMENVFLNKLYAF